VLKEEGLRSAEWNWGAPQEGGSRSRACNPGAPKEGGGEGGGGGGGLQSAERNGGEPIQSEEHWWDWAVLMPAEERWQGVGKDCGMHYRSASGNWRAPIAGWGTREKGYRVQNRIEERRERRNRLRNEIEESQPRLRSFVKDWEVPILMELHRRAGGYEAAPDVQFMV